MGFSQMCSNVMDCVDDLSTRITRQTVPIHTMVLGITIILCSLRTSLLLITKYKTDDRNVEIQEKESLFLHQTREYVGHIWTLCILKFLKSYANALVFLTCYPTVMKVCRCLTEYAWNTRWPICFNTGPNISFRYFRLWMLCPKVKSIVLYIFCWYSKHSKTISISCFTMRRVFVNRGKLLYEFS